MEISRDKIILQRLAMIKHLYSVAIEQSQKPEPLNAISILSLHDAVELFLYLSTEILDVSKGKGDIRFMDYWDIIEKGLQQKHVTNKLTQKVSMAKLNKARVGFKHYGTRPSKFDIEDARVNVKRFFDENTPVVFDIDFSEISLIDTVLCEESRKSLEEAKKNLNKGQIKIALRRIAIAFGQLIDDYEHRKLDLFGQSPFFFGESMTTLDSFSMGGERALGSDLVDFIDKVKESIEAIQDAVKILSLGIDYRRYVRFRLLTPHVVRLISGTYKVQEVYYGSRGTPSVEDVNYCINFVIESAITLQEFDFSLELAS